jgi:hypothetical protein
VNATKAAYTRMIADAVDEDERQALFGERDIITARATALVGNTLMVISTVELLLSNL